MCSCPSQCLQRVEQRRETLLPKEDPMDECSRIRHKRTMRGLRETSDKKLSELRWYIAAGVEHLVSVSNVCWCSMESLFVPTLVSRVAALDLVRAPSFRNGTVLPSVLPIAAPIVTAF